jgi:transposase
LPLVLRPRADPMVRLGREAISALAVGDAEFSAIPLGRLGTIADFPAAAVISPHPPTDNVMVLRKPPPAYSESMPATNPRAAGIDVGDATHWACVGHGPDDVREFPAHTPGLRELIDWLKLRNIETVALEATGVYGHVLYITLLEAGFRAVATSAKFTRQIQGRPKTDRRDCQWIRRLHALGLLAPVFEPDESTHALRSCVRQRANYVRLGAQHIQRMQKSLELMNLKLTKALGDITGVTGLKVIRAILGGVRDPHALAALRDRRCKHSAESMAAALDGRYRDEHLLELELGLQLWTAYNDAVARVDAAIAQQLRAMKRNNPLPALPPKPRVRGRKSHDPKFDVRTALYYASGVDLTAIEGIDEIHALTLLGELGSDFTKWPSAKHFTSWLGLCPNWKKTGGKVKSSRTRKGKNRAAHALRLAAWGLMRGTGAIAAYLRRQRSRLGAPKAITATAHELARIIYGVVRYGWEYVKKSEEEYAAQVRDRLEKQLQRRAREMGFTLTRNADPPPEVLA